MKLFVQPYGGQEYDLTARLPSVKFLDMKSSAPQLTGDWLTIAGSDGQRLQNATYGSNQVTVSLFIKGRNMADFRLLKAELNRVFYQLNNRFQYNVRQGDNSFSLTDALKFLFTGIGDGYSYQIHGKFNSNKTLTDFGNTSIIEGLSTIKGAFGLYAIVPDNKVIHLYDKDSYVKNTHKVFRYRNDTSAVQLQYDATSIVNTVQAVSTAEKPAFTPFKVQNADSVAKWGIKEGARVESDKITSTDAMKNLASQSFVLEPSLAMTVTSAGNEDVVLGENWAVQMLDNGFQTSVEVVSIVRAPFATSAVQITLNNTRKNFLDAQKVQQSAVNTAKRNTGTTGNMWVIGKVVS